MENILELFYDLPRGKISGQDTPFVRAAHTKLEQLERLNKTLTDEQKQMLDGYFDADAIIGDIISFDKFRYAFHLGAQLMAELIEGREEVL